jgi:hypothetical protein
MYTSYFGNPKILGNQFKLVSVSRRPPKFFSQIDIYKPLCPNWNLVSNYKSRLITKEEYIKEYYDNNLNKLDPLIVFGDLGMNSILLCYEKAGDFCHRRLIAEWLQKYLDVEIDEL